MPYWDGDCVIDNGVEPVNLAARVLELEGALDELVARVEALEGDSEGDAESAEGGTK